MMFPRHSLPLVMGFITLWCVVAQAAQLILDPRTQAIITKHGATLPARKKIKNLIVHNGVHDPVGEVLYRARMAQGQEVTDRINQSRCYFCWCGLCDDSIEQLQELHDRERKDLAAFISLATRQRKLMVDDQQIRQTTRELLGSAGPFHRHLIKIITQYAGTPFFIA